MKITFICNEYPPFARAGGIGIFTHTIAHGLVDCGHEVTVLGYGKNSGEWDDKGVRVVILPEFTVRGIAWFVNRRRLYSWLRERSRAGEIDIIETPEYEGMLPFRFPWRPVIVRLHTSFLSEHAFQRFLERKTLGIHRNWIAVSRWVGNEARIMHRVSPLRMSVVYNPVGDCTGNLAAPSGLPDDYVLYAGTVRDRKGAYVLAEAALRFLSEFPNLHLVYVGGLTLENGRRADETILEILGPRYADRVHFTGLVDHDTVFACMKRARVFAFPSKLEAFGLAPLEAMSCGAPVVYSALHSGPEMIEDGVTGLLADPYRPDDIAEKVMTLLRDPLYAAMLAGNAQKAVKERFPLSRCLKETTDFYDAVMGSFDPARMKKMPANNKQNI